MMMQVVEGFKKLIDGNSVDCPSHSEASREINSPASATASPEDGVGLTSAAADEPTVDVKSGRKTSGSGHPGSAGGGSSGEKLKAADKSPKQGEVFYDEMII